MIDKSNKNYTVCDITKIILRDDVSIYPKYIEVRDQQAFEYSSHDPNNEILKPGILKNRIAYIDEKSIGEVPFQLNGMHFLSEELMRKYIEKTRLLDKKIK